MRFSKTASLYCLIGALSASVASAQQPIQPIPMESNSPGEDDAKNPFADPEEPEALNQTAGPAEISQSKCLDCCCEIGCVGCDSCAAGGCGMGRCALLACDLGDPVTLQELIYGCETSFAAVGGWAQLGYFTKDLSASGLGAFNTKPNQVQLQQGWLYFEKALEADCGIDWGFRADLMYGTDGPDTQAFGNGLNDFGEPRNWDNPWDHGGNYGFAIPQLYVELGNSDLSVRIGHFYTIIGYEVVTAPDNFFYSHSITMYNTEPFTHTGVLATKSVGDNATVYAGWTLGWDTGFDRFGNGSSFLGGVSYKLSDCVTATYATTAGDTGFRGDRSYMHSLVLDTTLTENLQYVIQNDYLRIDETGEDIVDVNQYFIYSINDCLAIGQRIEWWKSDGASFYEATSGLNIKPHANVVVRPEVRFDWSPANNFDQTSFGVDTVLTF